jgi:hypothetical protein
MTGDLGHLLPECREEAKLPAEERIERIQAERWISYPRAELTLRRMAELLRYPQRDRMPSLLLYGPTEWERQKSSASLCVITLRSLIRKWAFWNPA